MRTRIVALLLALAAPWALPSSAYDSCTNCILIYGDSRSGHDVHKIIVAEMLSLSPDAVFHTGDLVDDGYDAGDWKIFNDITKELRVKTRLFPVLGSHERESRLYFKNFRFLAGKRWYAVDLHGIHFIVLDTNVDYSTGSAQGRWLETDLAKAAGSAPFIVVLPHHPIYDTGLHAKSSERIRKDLVPLLEKYSISAVFSGHDHDYERSLVNGITHIVTGGGGAPIYRQKHKSPSSWIFLSAHHFCALSISGDRIQVAVYDPDVKELDRFEILPNSTPALTR